MMVRVLLSLSPLLLGAYALAAAPGLAPWAGGLPDASSDPVEGVVREASGRAVAAAHVSLQSDGRVLVSTRTDGEGRFRLLPRSRPEGDLVLRVERMGYATHEERLDEGTRYVELVLRPAPLPLPGLGVEARRDVCEGGEDAEARALWKAASRRHPGGLDTLGVATYLQSWNDTLRADGDGRGEVNDAEGLGVPGQRSSAPLLRLSWNRRVSREGYAFPVRRTDRDGSYSSWSYPPLEADFAPHFLDSVFGELHRFQLGLADREGWVLRFCTRERGKPYLQGTLELTPDTLLYRAEWHFRTPEPVEGAGGWTRFPYPSLDDPAPLPLPVESMIWRELPGGEVVRKAQWYEGWILSPGDSVPFLRSR